MIRKDPSSRKDIALGCGEFRRLKRVGGNGNPAALPALEHAFHKGRKNRSTPRPVVQLQQPFGLRTARGDDLFRVREMVGFVAARFVKMRAALETGAG